MQNRSQLSKGLVAEEEFLQPEMTISGELERLLAVLVVIRGVLWETLPPIPESNEVKDEGIRTPPGCRELVSDCVEKAGNIHSLAIQVKTMIGRL